MSQLFINRMPKMRAIPQLVSALLNPHYLVYLIGNEAACMANRLSINVISRRAGVAVYSRLSEDEIAEFLTETERKENKNTQNILLDICYLLFEEYPQKRPCVYILKLCRKIGQSLEEISLRGGKLVKNFILFWMNNKTIIEFDFRMIWRIVLCRSRRMLSTKAKGLGGKHRPRSDYESSHPSQPHSIIAK